MYIVVFLLLTICINQMRSEFFNYITIKTYTDDKPMTILRADTINDQHEVTEIIVENESIPTLKTGSFSNLTKLKYIHIHRNDVQHLESYIFQNLWKLRTINLNFNRIQEIPEHVFEDLSVTKITLKGNGIRSLQDRAFYNLSELQVLDLSWNNIEELPQELFYLTTNLRELFLSYNRLRYYPGVPKRVPYSYFNRAFANINKYEYSVIDLSFNNFSLVSEYIFKGLPGVKDLFLNNNNIEMINEYAFNDLIFLDKLYLQGNNLLELNDRLLDEFEMIDFIDMSNNPWTHSFVCRFERWCDVNKKINTMESNCTHYL